MACNIKKGDPLRNLGFSQEREVAWIESQGYEYEMRPVETLDTMRSMDAAGNIYHGDWSIDESGASSYPGGRPGVKEGFGVMVRTDGTSMKGNGRMTGHMGVGRRNWKESGAMKATSKMDFLSKFATNPALPCTTSTALVSGRVSERCFWRFQWAGDVHVPRTRPMRWADHDRDL